MSESWMDEQDAADIAFDFDTTTAVSQPDYSPIPRGTYRLVIKSFGVRQTKDNGSGPGEQLTAQYVVVEGEHKGRIIFDSFTRKNANEKAVQIGQDQQRRLLAAVDSVGARSVAALVGKEFLAVVDVEEAKGAYEAKNKVKKYQSLGGTPGAPPKTSSIAPSGAKPKPPAFIR